MWYSPSVVAKFEIHCNLNIGMDGLDGISLLPAFLEALFEFSQQIISWLIICSISLNIFLQQQSNLTTYWWPLHFQNEFDCWSCTIWNGRQDDKLPIKENTNQSYHFLSIIIRIHLGKVKKPCRNGLERWLVVGEGRSGSLFE